MEMELGRLIAVIGKSVSEAQRAIQANAIDNYFAYFQPCAAGVEGGDNALRSQTAAVMVPTPDGEENMRVDVPLAAMVNHSAMALDSVNIKLNVPIASAEEGGVMLDLGKPQPGEPGPSATTEMELRFRCGEPPEGIARINTELNKFL